MCNDLLQTVGIHTIGFTMCRSYKIVLYTVLLSVVDGEGCTAPYKAFGSAM